MKTVPMTECDSSQIAAHGFCAETQTLHPRFRNKTGVGATYTYANFTTDDYAAFTGAESLGKHFGQFIKRETEKHPWTKLEAPKADAEEQPE